MRFIAIFTAFLKSSDAICNYGVDSDCYDGCNNDYKDCRIANRALLYDDYDCFENRCVKNTKIERRRL